VSLLAFRLGDLVCAAPLAGVREVVRLGAIRPLPGATLPLVGLTEVRGQTVRVLDPRGTTTTGPGPAAGDGDLVVLSDGSGVACDEVLGVREDEEATPAAGLPPYATGLLVDGTLLVDLAALGSVA